MHHASTVECSHRSMLQCYHTVFSSLLCQKFNWSYNHELGFLRFSIGNNSDKRKRFRIDTSFLSLQHREIEKHDLLKLMKMPFPLSTSLYPSVTFLRLCKQKYTLMRQLLRSCPSGYTLFASLWSKKKHFPLCNNNN